MNNNCQKYSNLKFSKILIATLAFFIFAILSLTPINIAHAKSYEMNDTKIEATVGADRSLSVEYDRQYDFSGDFECIIMPLGSVKSGSEMVINSVSLNQGGADTPLSPVDFQSSWRNSGGPGTTCYSYDAAEYKIYIFGSFSDEVAVAKVNYSITNAVSVYADCAELYWQFCASYDDDSKNVTCNIHLPVPAGETPAADSILAWGHGDLTSKLTNNNDGNVSISVPTVSGGEYAEARVLFPQNWVSAPTDASAAADLQTAKRDSIKSEESAWLDSAKSQFETKKLVSFLMFWIPILLALIFIVVCIILWFKYGKEPAPTFTEKYWRDVPDKNAHPLTVARNERWGKGETSDLTAELMHLHMIDAIKIERVQTKQERKILSDKIVDDFMISKTEKADTLENRADSATIKFLFDDIGARVGRDYGQVSFEDIKSFGKKNGEEMKRAYDTWQAAVGVVEYNPEPIFDDRGMKISSKLGTLSSVLVVLSVVIIYFTLNLIPTIALIVSTIVCVFFKKIMMKRTQYGADLHAKSEALKNWLCDFTNLGERPPDDMKVWGEFMVYATILGVAKEAIKQLKIAEPNFEEMSWDYGMMPYSWWWFYAPSSSIFGAGSGVNFFDSVISNTMDSISVGTGAGGGFGDFGGGFSLGGGGGFGGGFSGGGAR